MIKLKNGYEVAYDKDIDIFFQSLVKSIIHESLKAVGYREREPAGNEAEEDRREDDVLREIMDNCIFVTHQIFEIAKTDEKLARFLTSGFLFNYVMQLYRKFEKSYGGDSPDKDPGKVH